MNKKVVLAAAGILLVASLASCGRNSSDATTVPALTGATQSTLGSGQQPDSSAALVATTAGNASPTYILTTQQGQTMATVPLTAFSLDTTTPTSTVLIPDLNDITSPSLDNPNVLTSVKPTLPSTSPLPTVNPSTPGAVTTQKQTTTTKPTTTEPTTAAQKSRKLLVDSMVSCGTDPNNGNFIIKIDPTDWDGGIKSSTGFVNVDIDGKTFPAKAKVDGNKDIDGYATITVYSSELKPEDGDTITVNLGDGLVKSKKDNQESAAYTFAAEHKTSP